MARTEKVFTEETFAFFRELACNNSKPWMDENRLLYKQHVVAPFRKLLDALVPAAQKLHPGFCFTGRTGENFSRINRDIRFANDKQPYYSHMYLFLSHLDACEGSCGQLYVGISGDAATAGFRTYRESRQSAMSCFCVPRAMQNLAWLASQRKKFARKYEGYWYSTEKGKWTKHSGWPADAKEWKRAKGWVIRKRFAPSIAMRSSFTRQAVQIFRELFPLYSFACLPEREE